MRRETGDMSRSEGEEKRRVRGGRGGERDRKRIW